MKLIKNNPKWLDSIKTLPEIDINIKIHGGHRQKVNYGWVAEKENHNAFEIMYIISGVQKTKYELSTVNYKIGDIVLISPGILHENSCQSRWGLEYFCMHFDIDNPSIQNDLSIYFPKTLNEKNKFYSEVKKYIYSFMDMIKKDSYNTIDKLNLQITLLNFIILLLDVSKKNKENVKIDTNKTTQSAITIAKIINTNYIKFKNNPIDENKDLLKISNIAKKLNISESKMLKEFKKTYGMSPKFYLSKLRYNDARSLLVHSYLSIEDISQMLGFSSTSNFSRQFKIRCKLSPSEYRLSKIKE